MVTSWSSETCANRGGVSTAGRYFCLGLPQRRHTVGGRAASRAAAARGCSLGAGALADAGGGLLWLFWRNSEKYSAEEIVRGLGS